LAVAVTCVVFVVTKALYSNWLPAAATAGSVALILICWYMLPLVVRFQRR
jgi:hypothetical protein